MTPLPIEGVTALAADHLKNLAGSGSRLGSELGQVSLRLGFRNLGKAGSPCIDSQLCFTFDVVDLPCFNGQRDGVLRNDLRPERVLPRLEILVEESAIGQGSDHSARILDVKTNRTAFEVCYSVKDHKTLGWIGFWNLSRHGFL
jgi:hypothetical protein